MAEGIGQAIGVDVDADPQHVDAALQVGQLGNVAASVLLATGCATLRTDITPVRNAWLGAGYEEVVTRWGTPMRSTSSTAGSELRTVRPSGRVMVWV